MMYEVYIDDKLLFYPNDNINTIINAKLDQALNEAGTFECDVPVTNPNYSSIDVRSSMIQVLKDGVEIFLGEVHEVTQNFDFTKHIYAVGELAFLFDSIQPQARYQTTPASMFASIVTHHNNQVEDRKKFTIGNVLVTDPNDYVYHYTNYEDTLTALREKMCDTLNGFLKIRKVNGIRYLDLVPLSSYGSYCNQSIEFGENMLEYSANTSAESLATAVIPLGARLEDDKRTSSAVEGLDEYVTIKSVNNNVDYVFIQSAVNNHGWVKVVKTWDDVNTPSILKSKAEDWLTNAQYATMTLELNAVDLSLLDSDIDAFNIGDTVRATAEPFGMNTTFPVRKKTTYINELSKNYIVLSNEEPVKSYTSQASKAVSLIEEQIPEKNTLLEEARSRALAMLLSETTGGHVVFEYDTNNSYIEAISVCNAATIDASTSRWRWSNSGFGFMTRDNINQPWSGVKVAMTSGGEIVANMITTGTLASSVMQTNVINAINDSNLTINAERLNINGAVTFSDLDASTQTTINNKLDSNDLNGYTKDVNLANGTTTIKGQCISTGAIKSNNYSYTDKTSSFATSGTYISLTDGNIFTPSFSFFSGTNPTAYFKGSISASNITGSKINSSVLQSTNYSRTTTGYFSDAGISIDLNNANIITPTFSIWKDYGTHMNCNLDTGSVGGLEIYNTSDNQHGFQYNKNNYFFRVGTKDITCGCAYGSGWSRLDWIPEWGMLRVDYGDAGSASKGLIVTNAGNNNKADNGSNYIQIKNTQIYRHRSDWGLSYPVWTGNDDTSDINAKTNVTDIPKEDVKYIYEHLRPIHFNYKDELDIRGEHFGVVAQDMDKALSDLGYTDNVIIDNGAEDNYMRLHYYETIGLQIAGVKYLYEEVDLLKKEIELLKQEIKILKGDKQWQT